MVKATPIPQESRDAVQRRSGMRCDRCRGYSPNGEWHHRRSRSVRDGLEHSPANGVWLCPPDHRWVHAHPIEARALGLIISRHVADPATVPLVLPQGQQAWLLHDGGWTFES